MDGYWYGVEMEEEGGNGWSNVLYNPVWILNIRYVVPTLCCSMIAVVVYVKLEDNECGGFVFVNGWTKWGCIDLISMFYCLSWRWTRNKLWNSAKIKWEICILWKESISTVATVANTIYLPSFRCSTWPWCIRRTYSLFYLILLQCDLYFYYCLSNRRRSKLMGGKSRRQMSRNK